MHFDRLRGIVGSLAVVLVAGCGGSTGEADAGRKADALVFEILASDPGVPSPDGDEVSAGTDGVAETGEGPDVGMDLAVDPAADVAVDLGVDPEGEPGPDLATDPAIDPANDPAVDPAPDPAADPAPDPQPDPAADPAPDPGVDVAADPVVEVTPIEPGLAKASAIYPHTSGELFVWNATTTPPTKVGNFTFPNDGLDHTMTDMAIDYDGRLYGVTFGGLYHCMADTAKCTNLASFDEQFNGLTIVPEGTLQANAETLVAISNAGGWYRVDVVGTKAVLTHLGDYGSGYTSAGDAYSIKGVGTWAAVNGGSGGTLLVQVDPLNGKVLKELGTIPGEDIWGLAGYSDQVFAFDSSGMIYQGSATGGATFQEFLNTSHSWYGAAVSTRDH